MTYETGLETGKLSTKITPQPPENLTSFPPLEDKWYEKEAWCQHPGTKSPSPVLAIADTWYKPGQIQVIVD